MSESIYLTDPDGNGVEIYADKPESEWTKDENGNLVMYTEALNLPDLLSELE